VVDVLKQEVDQVLERERLFVLAHGHPLRFTGTWA